MEVLQVDGRRPFTEIATAFTVPESTIRARYKSLVDRGALKVIAVADPLKVGYPLMAMIGVRCTPAALLATAGARPDVAQGLLTGNVERGARTKLSHHDLWDHFPFGAFADDSEFRNELGPHALRRAHAHTGVHFPPTRTWIIGDTPHDIACARVIGANVIAVATGTHTAAELAAHSPDALLADLADAAAFWNIITSSS